MNRRDFLRVAVLSGLSAVTAQLDGGQPPKEVEGPDEEPPGASGLNNAPLRIPDTTGSPMCLRPDPISGGLEWSSVRVAVRAAVRFRRGPFS